MRYHYIRPDNYSNKFGKTYKCNHPVYNRCTLYLIEDKGLAVIQQRYDWKSKHTWWTEIDPWLVDELYLHKNFRDYFILHADTCSNGLYPTVTIRQIMWGLKMKPIKRQSWETVFDKAGF